MERGGGKVEEDGGGGGELEVFDGITDDSPVQTKRRRTMRFLSLRRAEKKRSWLFADRSFQVGKTINSRGVAQRSVSMKMKINRACLGTFRPRRPSNIRPN